MPNDQSWNVAAPRLAQNISLLAAYVALAAPAISASAASSSSITISLTSPVNGATRYTIYRSTDGETWGLLIDDRTESDFPHTDNNLDPKTIYYYHATASNETYTSDPSGVTQDETLAEQGGGGGEPTAANLVSDDFSSRDLSSPQVNTVGFSWGAMNRTSLVIVDPQDGERVVFNGSSVYNPNGDPARDWTPFQSGGVSLRFRHPSEAELSGASNPECLAEQRFSMSVPQRDLWLKKRLRVPVNFIHEDADNEGSWNNKLFMLWMDDYVAEGGVGSTVGMEFRGDGSGGSYFYVKMSPAGGGNLGGDMGGEPFISYPDDQGKWMQVIAHVVAETSPGASDGSVEVWQEWWSGSEWTGRTKKFNFTGLGIALPPSGPQGFAGGYLLGAHNSGYQEETEWLADLFELSTESLL